MWNGGRDSQAEFSGTSFFKKMWCRSLWPSAIPPSSRKKSFHVCDINHTGKTNGGKECAKPKLNFKRSKCGRANRKISSVNFQKTSRK